MSRAVRALLAVIVASGVGCRRPASVTSDAGTVDAAPMNAAPLAASASAAPVVDAAIAARVPVAETDGTIGLLVEHVLIDPGQQPAGSYGYDLLVLTALPGKKTVRSQPFCPPLKRNMYEVCRRFRACSMADAGAAVVCDGARFELVQHDGVTFLQGETKEIEVSKETPAIVRASTRERRAYVDL